MYSHQLFEKLRAIANDPETLKKARKSERYFTRNRKMSFADALCFMLDMRKTTVQTRLNLYYRMKGEEPMSQQAFSKLRSHYDHSPFETMTRSLVKSEYSETEALQKYLGYHVFSVDGSWLQLPRTKKIRAVFGTNGNEGDCPCAGTSILYDVLSGWVLNPIITHARMDERDECKKHISFLLEELPHIVPQSLILMDRGYPSFHIIKTLHDAGMKYLVRCSSSFLSEVNTAPMGESTILIKRKLQARIYKFLLPSGTTEILLTNLFDVSRYELAELYSMRWGIETAFHRLKRELCVEKFSGETPLSILQDFWASMVIMNSVAVFEQEANVALKDRQQGKNLKYEYKTRCSDLIVTLRDEFIFAVLQPDRLFASAEIERIIRLMARSVSSVRPDRSYARRPTPCRHVNHHLKSHL